MSDHVLAGLTAENVLRCMNYRGAKEVCENCANFRPAGQRIDPTAEPLPDHCRLNPAFVLPVNRLARCDHFEAKE